MKSGYTMVAMILDRSGSMEVVREATIAGFNEFIRTQRELPGECDVLLVQFDNMYEQRYAGPLSDVPEMTAATYVPRGGTALLDALGRTMVELGGMLAAKPEEERPSKVIVVTMTDGAENSSKEYSSQRARELVKQQREVYGWDFVYLGANQDAVLTAESMNMASGSAMTFASRPAAMKSVMQSLTSSIGEARSKGALAEFTSAQRQSAMDSSSDGTRVAVPVAGLRSGFTDLLAKLGVAADAGDPIDDRR